MSFVRMQLPASLYEHIKILAAAEGVTVEAFVTLALAEKIASLETADYLQRRAQRGNRDKLLAVLAKAPDVEPEAYDRL